MNRDDIHALHAYLDGEIELSESIAFEQRLAAEPALRDRLERQRALSALVRREADYHRAPAALGRWQAPAEPASRATRPLWWPAMALAALLSIGAAYLVVREPDDGLALRDLVGSHVRASLSGHVIDVASSDQHTVKPWLSARLDYSPPVPDLSGHGYALAGARLDYVGARQVAVLVYQRRQHVIDVFVRPGDGPAAPRAASLDGFHEEHFASGGMDFRVVSDLNVNELRDFAQHLAAASR